MRDKCCDEILTLAFDAKLDTVDFIVPTLNRPGHLQRCLAALERQTVKPTQVVVGIRSDDTESPGVVEAFTERLSLKVADAQGVGVVGSMNSCLAQCTARYIGLLDDDVELPEFWLERMIYHLNGKPRVIGAGGRDLLMDHPEMRRTEPLVDDVGTIHLYGRMTGNHHRGGGQPRMVDILRGSNCLFCGEFLRSVGFEKALAGSGAQVNWELALALQARAQGYRLFYDPTTEVVHHVATRHDNDTVHRGEFNASGTTDIAHNETLVVLKHARGIFRATILLWQSFVGSQTCPGMLRVFEGLVRSSTPFAPRFLATVKGRARAILTCLRQIEHAN